MRGFVGFAGVQGGGLVDKEGDCQRFPYPDPSQLIPTTLHDPPTIPMHTNPSAALLSGTARTRAKTLPRNQVVIKTGEQPQ